MTDEKESMDTRDERRKKTNTEHDEKKEWTPQNMGDLLKGLRQQERNSPRGQAAEALHQLLGIPRFVAERATHQALDMAQAYGDQQAIVDYERAMQECVRLRKAADEALMFITGANGGPGREGLRDELEDAITATAFLTELDDSGD